MAEKRQENWPSSPRPLPVSRGGSDYKPGGEKGIGPTKPVKNPVREKGWWRYPTPAKKSKK